MVGRAGRRGVDDPRGAGGARATGKRRGGRSATSCDSRRQRALLLGRARIRSAGDAGARRRRCWTRWRPPATPAPSWATGDSCRPIPRRSRRDVARRGLALVGAFVPVALADATRRSTQGIERAVRNCAAAARGTPSDEDRPTRVIVLSDDNATRAASHRARRTDPRRGRPARETSGTASPRARASGSRPRCATRPAAHGVSPSLRRLRRNAARSSTR